MDTDYQGTLLIADDMPSNLKVLLSCLADLNYKVLVAQDGEDALEKALYAKPDLILLDVMMPKLDGFETCRRLKGENKTRDIPVLFMTALSDTVDKVKGFEAGAVDYITKPFQREEVLIRIKTHLNLRYLQKTLREQNLSLKRQNTELHAQNRELTLLDGYASYLGQGVARLREFIIADHTHPALYPSAADPVWQTLAELTDTMSDSIEHMRLLNQLRVAPPPVLQRLPMAALVQNVLNRLQPSPGAVQLPQEWPEVLGQPEWVEKIWEIYLGNALRHGGTPPEVRVGHDSAGEHRIRFWVKDNGPGFTPQQQSQMGDGYIASQASSSGPSIPFDYGFSLSLVQRIMDRLGGQVRMESTPGRGSTFYFSLHED